MRAYTRGANEAEAIRVNHPAIYKQNTDYVTHSVHVLHYPGGYP